MEPSHQIINGLLIDIFNDILHIEESVLKAGEFSDLSVTEMHTVEAIGLFDKPTMGEVAKKLDVTVGTLSVAVANLVSKGYAQRFRGEDDRRVVRIGLTKKGRVLFRVHERFHMQVVKASVEGLTEDEEKVITKAFVKLHSFLKGKYAQSHESGGNSCK